MTRIVFRVSGEGEAVGSSGGAVGRAWVATCVLYLVSFAAALGAATALVTLTGHSVGETLLALYEGSLHGGASIGQTIDEATPLLLVATGAIICARAGIFNIGQEGQLLIGAMAGAAIGLFLSSPVPGADPALGSGAGSGLSVGFSAGSGLSVGSGTGWVVLVLVLGGAALAGAVWAGIPALLFYWRGVDVVISTLLLVFVAVQLVSFAVNRDYLLQETAVKGQILSQQSDALPEGVRLPRLGEYPDFTIGTGVFVALALTVVVAVLLRYGRWGFRLRMLGLNRVAAHRAGVRAAALGGGALLLSGGFAGLAGGVMLTGTVFRIQPGLSDNVGWEGLLVALVARNHPLAAVPVAVFFGALRAGGGFLASTGVPRYLVSVVTALLVLAAVFPAAYAEARGRRRRMTVWGR
ncbi:ABC transporter permease [Sphaerisporangium flaviroseum]|uniref:ABC transporter permease n=1 Tax=Sphaerisporangium flaviroseum TaxID=509199 RepID=A0ABP7HI19_9ACTN